MNLHAGLAIARKDIVDAVRNLYILFGLLLPVGMWLFFQVLFPSESAAAPIGAVAVFDQGQSRLVEQIRADPLVKRVIDTRSEDELRQVVLREAVGGIVLAADFDSAVAEGRSPELPVLFDGRRGGGELGSFRRLIDTHVRKLESHPPAALPVWSDVNGVEGAATGGGASAGTREYILVLLLVMGLAMTGALVVPTLLVEEKEKHTLKAILVSPAGYIDVVVGKALAGMFYSLLIAVVLLALNDGLRGNVPLLALAVVLGSLVMVQVGLLMGAVFTTSAQVNTWSSIVMLVLMVPAMTVGAPLPQWLEFAMRVVPSYFVGQLVQAARAGTAAVEEWVSVGALLATAAVLFAAIVWSLRRERR